MRYISSLSLSIYLSRLHSIIAEQNIKVTIFFLSPKRRSSIGTFIRPHSSEGTHPTKPNKAPPHKLDYRSMVSIDDMPELFVSFDSKYSTSFCWFMFLEVIVPFGIITSFGLEKVNLYFVAHSAR